MAAFQGGADFSGSFNDTFMPVQQQTAVYQHIRGVNSAAAGYSATEYIRVDNAEFPIEFLAVDGRAFAHTAIWTEQDSTQSLQSLMTQLIAQSSTATKHNLVPAIVDAATWNALDLSSGEVFTMTMDDSGDDAVHFVAVAEVQHIPTVSDRGGSVGTNGGITSGGVLVNFQSYANVVANIYDGQSVPLNYAWIDTHDDAASVAYVRAVLNSTLVLQPLYDRRATITNLSSGPLYLDLGGILAIGTSLALNLALLGNMIASWMSATSRLTNFAVLRTLGGSRMQLARILTLEQSIIYSTALGLGILFGTVLAKLALPTLIITSVSTNGAGTTLSTGQFYSMQNVPPVQVVIPASLEIALALLIVICAVAIGTMVRIVTRPSLGQALRLNED